MVCLALLHPGCQYPPSFLSAQEVRRLYSTPTGSPDTVRKELSAASGSALLDQAFRSTLTPHAFLHSSIPVLLLMVAWRTLRTWTASIVVPVCCVFTALNRNSTRHNHICYLHDPFSFNITKLHGLSVHTAKDILLYGSLVDKPVSLGVISFLLVAP